MMKLYGEVERAGRVPRTRLAGRRFELLLLSALVLASCAPGEGERRAEAVPPEQPPAVVEESRAAEGLRLPVAGEVFLIGDEQWEVVATSVAFPKDPVQQDTQIIDVTVQARRLAAAPVEYLGQEG